MTETTPPAATAAPGAAPAVAPASATPPAPAAPAAAAPPPAAPTAAPPAAAPPAAPGGTPPPAAAEVVDSLIPADPAAPPAAAPTEAEKIEAARKLVKEADAAADPNSGKAWLLHDGVMGQGEKPSWFRSDKYKTVAAQAAAYPELEKRFGGFVGAPKNEKGEVAYQFKPPEGFSADVLNMDHPVMQSFTAWAAENQLSQDGYNALLGQLLQYEAAQAPNMGEIKTRLGDNADQRIATASSWVKANLGAEGFSTFRTATSGKNADAVFKMVEQLINKTGQVRMPGPGDDVPGGTGGEGLKAIQDAHGARTPDGKLKVDVDPKYRLEIDKRYRDYYAAQRQ